MNPTRLACALLIAGLSALVPQTADGAPARADRDRDGLTDRWERRAHTNPKKRDTDRDGIGDGREDHDRDRMVNAVEAATGNHPARRDTDGDGLRDSAEGAGQVVEIDGQTVTIALGASTAFSAGLRSPLATVASAGRRVTGRAELPHALLCGDAEEWLGPVDRTSDGAEDEAQREAADEEQYEDGDESDAEVARYSAASTDKVEGNPVLSDDELEKIEDAEYAEMGHEDDPDHATLSDACPPGAFKAGAWVHEVTVDSSEEAGTEFEEIVIVH